VDFFAHSITQGLVNQLVLLHLVFAPERFTDNHRFPVVAVSGDFDMFAVKPGDDGLFDAFWCDHAQLSNQFLSL
jgi:hypothetical protein